MLLFPRTMSLRRGTRLQGPFPGRDITPTTVVSHPVCLLKRDRRQTSDHYSTEDDDDDVYMVQFRVHVHTPQRHT